VEALKLADKKAETERLLREEDERRAKELQEIEIGKKLHAEAEKKLQAEKDEFERKQKEELEKFFKEKQELERQKQELIESKRLARTQQLTSIGYKLEGRHFQFMNKYGTSHLIEVNCIILDDEQWGSVVEQAIIRKKKLLSQEEERDEQEEKIRKENEEKQILEEQAKAISVDTVQEKEPEIIIAVVVNEDAKNIAKWIGEVEVAAGSVDSSWIENPLIVAELNLAKEDVARSVERLRDYCKLK
jgi:hypothetical protein